MLRRARVANHANQEWGFRDLSMKECVPYVCRFLFNDVCHYINHYIDLVVDVMRILFVESANPVAAKIQRLRLPFHFRGLQCFGAHAFPLRTDIEGRRHGMFVLVRILVRNITFLALPDTENRDVAEFKTILGT